MEPVVFVVLAYVLTGVALGALCVVSAVRARAIRRQLELSDLQ